MTAPVFSKINLTELGYCPSCKKVRSSSPKYTLPRTNVYHCCACGLEYIDPSLDADSMVLIYSSAELLKQVNPALENYYEYQTLNPKSRTAQDYLYALKAAVCAPGRSLLEIGCGGGGFLAFAKQQGWDVTGLDSSSANIENVKSRGLDGICSGFLEYTGGRKFDVVVLWDLIEHPQDPTAFIRKSAELLTPGGLLLIATPCYPNLLSLIAQVVYRFSGGRLKGPAEKLYFLEHTTYFGIKSLRAGLETEGFKIIKSWKSETDLNRYKFPAIVRFGLVVSFFIARLINFQNRLLVLASK